MQRVNEVSRRRFMAAAASTCLGVGVAAGPGASLLRAANATPAGVRHKAKAVIYVYLAGGMSHIDTFDPKSGETKGQFEPVRTSVPGVHFTDRLPTLAKHADKMCVINSMTSTQGAHERGNYLMHTSYAPLGTIRHASIGAWVLHWAGRANQTLPGLVVVGNGGRHPGAGFLGSSYEPLFLGNPEQGLANVELPRGTTESQFQRRMSLAERFDSGFRKRYGQESVTAYSRFYDDAVKLMHSDDLAAFNLGAEPGEVRAAYGQNRFGQGLLLARRLVESGVRFVEVNSGGWDTHQDNFERLGENLLPDFDRGVGTLLADLASRGMLEETLVVVTTEFGRTPRINERDGRDHYPRAFSAVLAGGGVRGGQVYGRTDAQGAAVADNPVKPAELNATIAYAMGIDWSKEVISSIGRPFDLADNAGPVTGVF